MKTKFLFLLSFSAAVLTASAQVDLPTTPTTPVQTTNTLNAVQNAEKNAPTANSVAAKPVGGTGLLISQLTQNLNTTALTDDFNKVKSAFSKQAQSTSSTDVKGQSSLLQKLEAGLKSSAVSSGWAAIKTKWLSGVKTATTTKQIAGYLKTLSQNINTSALSPTWAKVKPAFDTELNNLTK